MVRPTALELRHRQAVIVARMTMEILKQARRDYPRKHIGAIFPDLLALMAIRDNDGDNGPPLTVSDIGKRVGVPRTTIDRAVTNLLNAGVLEKAGNGFRGRMDYVEARLDADFFKAMVAAILSAADQLRSLQSRE